MIKLSKCLKFVFLYYYDPQSEPLCLYSDETWKVDETNIITDGAYAGETFDIIKRLACQSSPWSPW